jgi:hypothetical protein
MQVTIDIEPQTFSLLQKVREKGVSLDALLREALGKFDGEKHLPETISEAGVSPRRWLDVAGSAPYPLFGEDAQAWVSRTRRTGGDEREKYWSENE